MIVKIDTDIDHSYIIKALLRLFINFH